jgi:hypothetical protein
MSSERAFRIPRAHKDRVHPRQLVAIAATCLSIGVALSGTIKSTPQEEPAWQQASAAPMLDTLPSVLEVTSALAAKVSTETSISAATSAVVDTSQPAAAVKPSNTPKLKLVRGALTYRCDGAPKSDACAHDRALEARVWRVLARLSSCKRTADAAGRADLKLWFGPGATTRAVFAAPTISPSLNLRAVSQCVARDLSKLRPTRKTDRFELSVSFGLVSSN